MLGNNYRPWGLLPWVLEKVSAQSWDLWGCLSTEERGLSVLSQLVGSNRLDSLVFQKIIDPPSLFTEETERKLLIQTQEFITLYGSTSPIEDHELFERHDLLIRRVDDFVQASGGNIIIDISSLPKKFFFPIIRRIIETGSNINNLIVTYTFPASYCDKNLAINPKPWNTLPLFGSQIFPEPTPQLAIAGVGYEPHSLPELLKNEYSRCQIRLLFPFPPGPPSFQRSWKFVQQVHKDLPINDSSQIVRVEARNVSDAFDHICSITNNGSRDAIFAPYGPKTISLAICLYAAMTDSPVYYTQPTNYNPNYSTGVKEIDGVPETYAYCLRLQGRDFYQV